MLLNPASSNAADFDLREYSLKAVFLERFTRFIDWPEEQSPENNLKPFVISIIGNPPFADLLRNIYQTQKIQGKKVVIQEIHSGDEINNPHLLYISQVSNNELARILEHTRHSPILTISDTDGFAEQGVMINFFMSNKQKIRFEINERAIKESELHISYKLIVGAE